MQREDLLRAQPGDLQHLHESGRHRGAELFQEFEPPRASQLRDLGGEGLADSLYAAQFTGLDQARELRFLYRLKGAGAALVGADLERILAREFEQRGDLRERIGDLVFGHGSSKREPAHDRAQGPAGPAGGNPHRQLGAVLLAQSDAILPLRLLSGR